MKEQDKHPDKIFVKGHLTTIEKLLFANKYIADLLQEISQLKYELGVLKSENYEYKAMSTEERRAVKTDEKVKQVLSERLILERSLRDCRKENDRLITENLQLKRNP